MRRSERRFDTLGACVDFLTKSFPDATTSAPDPCVRDGVAWFESDERPRYLFRGESEFYSETLPGEARLSNSGIASEIVAAILQARDRVASIVSAKLDELPPEERPSSELLIPYLQHYGLPTDHVDFTSSLKVAAFFASSRKRGRILVLPAESRAGLDLKDLSGHPYAWRPRAQRAFSVVAPRTDHWRGDTCIRKAGGRWFSFRVSATDRRRFGSMRYLTETHIDRVASLVTSAMYSLRRAQGPIDALAAKWIAERIPPLPLILRRDRAGDSMALTNVSPGEAGVVFIEADARAMNAHCWSN